MHRGVLVVGAGPAGLALATACAEADLPTTLVAADPFQRWSSTYGVWVDELAGLGVDGALARTWPRPLVGLDGRRPVALDRAYARIDNDGMQALLHERLRRAGGRVEAGRAERVVHTTAGARLVVAGGGALTAAVLVDATGHRPALARPAPRPPTGLAEQVAYGVRHRFAPPPVAPGALWLMDWRTGPLRGAAEVGDVDRLPTFSYAMDLGDGTAFVEETCLASRAPVELGLLRRRVAARLTAQGVPAPDEAAVQVERCRFPMGVGLPPLGQPTVAYGAAAAMVHPATGYSVGAALRRAGPTAAAIARAMAADSCDPPTLAAAAWDAVWPADLVRQRRLHALGLEVLLQLGSAEVQTFFGAFFSLPTRAWAGYLSGAASSRALAATMVAVARRLPSGLQARLLRTAARQGALPLLGAALGTRWAVGRVHGDHDAGGVP